MAGQTFAGASAQNPMLLTQAQQQNLQRKFPDVTTHPSKMEEVSLFAGFPEGCGVGALVIVIRHNNTSRMLDKLNQLDIPKQLAKTENDGKTIVYYFAIPNREEFIEQSREIGGTVSSENFWRPWLYFKTGQAPTRTPAPPKPAPVAAPPPTPAPAPVAKAAALSLSAQAMKMIEEQEWAAFSNAAPVKSADYKFPIGQEVYVIPARRYGKIIGMNKAKGVPEYVVRVNGVHEPKSYSGASLRKQRPTRTAWNEPKPIPKIKSRNG